VTAGKADSQPRSRRSKTAWLNWTSRGTSREPKEAKTREQGVWAYLEQASHDEVFLRWRKHRLGAMRNSWSLVNDWRQAWVLWMGDYPMELTMRSIYNGLKRWLGIWTKTCGGRKNRKSRAWLVSFVVANSPTMNRHRKPSYCDVVKRIIAWRDRGKWRCPR
jgi:hypothetical protein